VYLFRFVVLVVVVMENAVVWDVASCSLISVYRCPERMNCVYLQTYSPILKMEAAYSSPNSKAVPYYTATHLRRQ
jgi:hypothetical protein